MKRRCFLMAVFSLFLVALQAQTVAPCKRSAGIVFIGHTITIFKMAAGYGYDISYQNRLLVHQTVNPVTGKPTGLTTGEDALKLAKWQIIHFGHPGSVLTPEEKTISKTQADQIHISAN